MSMASSAKKLKEWLEEAAEKLQESDWSPVAGSIANTSSQTFQYGGEGGPTATFSGLGAVEAVPSEVTVTQGGDTLNVSSPSYSQLGMQGYAPKINPKYAEAKKKYDEEYAEWEKAREEK